MKLPSVIEVSAQLNFQTLFKDDYVIGSDWLVAMDISKYYCEEEDNINFQDRFSKS